MEGVLAACFEYFDVRTLARRRTGHRTRHWVFSASAPRVTPANPLHRQPGPPPHPVQRHRLDRVLRAGRREAAARERTKQKCLRRGDHVPINLHTGHQNVLCRIQDPDARSPFNNPAFRNVVKRSRSTSWNDLPTMDERAISTRSTGRVNRCWLTLNDSRSKRRARLRTTAPPSLPLVMTPRRVPLSAAAGSQFATRHPCANLWPEPRSRAKSRPCLIRAARPNRDSAFIGQPFTPASGVSGPPGVDSARFLCRSCSNSGSGTRAAVSGVFSMVDIVASYKTLLTRKVVSE